VSRARARAAERPGAAGFLVVDKPPGWTSHDAVDAARRWLGTRRVGHLGTLDPQATGVLPLAVREATKLVGYVPESGKCYVGSLRFGIETDTLDGEGRVLRRSEGPPPRESALRAALAEFRGDIEQVPPMYSAVKQGGVPLHRRARRGEEVARAPKKVRIHRLELLRFDPEQWLAEVFVECSAGTYVRVLAADLGSRLGCGAYLMSLRRTRSGPFAQEQALAVAECEELAAAGRLEERLIPPAVALGIPVWRLPEAGARRVANGADLPPGTSLRVAPGDRVLAVDEAERPLALLEMRADRRLWPLRVLRQADS
jgi:tRNA pseudouridine55 synthase